MGVSSAISGVTSGCSPSPEPGAANPYGDLSRRRRPRGGKAFPSAGGSSPAGAGSGGAMGGHGQRASVSGDGTLGARSVLLGLGLAVMKDGSPVGGRRICGRLTRRLGITIGPEIPRATVSAVSIVAITLVIAVLIVAVLERAIGPRTSVLKSVALTILAGCEAPSVVVTALTLALVSRSLNERLWGVGRRGWLGLKSLLRLRERLLPLGGRSETIRHPAKIAVIVQVVLVLWSLLTALGERLCGLSRCNQPEVMFGVLQVILCSNRVAACMGVSCKLEIFFRDVMGVAADFDVGSIRFIGSRQRIGPTSIVRRSAAHPLVLTWSHFNFLISIRLAQSLSDRFGANFSNLMQETVHAFASLEWADLITPDIRT